MDKEITKGITIALTEKNEKTVTTVQGDYTSVYKDVSIKSNNYETYTINEINAPSEYVIYDKKITMSVNNGLITSEDGSYYAPNLVIISVDIDGDGSINSNEEIILTKKEYSLLLFLLNNPNFVHSRESIVQNVWDKPVSTRAVDTNITRLRQKLGKYGENIYTRMGFGYGFKTK